MLLRRESAICLISANGCSSALGSRLADATDCLTLLTMRMTGKFDEVVEDKGVMILIDPKALMHVIGTKMDFVDDTLKSEFVFINPNSKGQCGCGESFITNSSKVTRSGSS